MARRNTIQRSLVLEAVNKLHCHATADEVYEEIIIGAYDIRGDLLSDSSSKGRGVFRNGGPF